MRVMKNEKILSQLIPKNHFCSMSMFREPPLIHWTYTDSVLFTAYDIYRSNDFWLDSIIREGKTLKEGLTELGFPKGKKLVVDTGIFEMEAKKAGIARELGIDVDIQLSKEQIFEAYQLSGADYYVAPDEIILPNETDTVSNLKIHKIQSNLIELLEEVPSSKIIAVIQGHTEEVITGLFEFYRDHDIACFAMGGVIPLYHHSKSMLEKVLQFAREITEGYWLHIFGLPHLGLLEYYLHKIRVDSVDTSAILYITARRRYLIGSKSEQVRNAKFQDCSCEGCKNLSPFIPPQSQQFFLNLFIHNMLQAVKLSSGQSNLISERLESQENEKQEISLENDDRVNAKKNSRGGMEFRKDTWMSAADTLHLRERTKDE